MGRERQTEVRDRERLGNTWRVRVRDFLYVHTSIFRERGREGDMERESWRFSSMYTYIYIQKERERETWRERIGGFLYVHTSIFIQRERHGETELEIFSVYTYLYSEREREGDTKRESWSFSLCTHIYIHTEKERATGSPCSVLWDEVGSTVPRVGDRQILKVVLNPLG